MARPARLWCLFYSKQKWFWLLNKLYGAEFITECTCHGYPIPSLGSFSNSPSSVHFIRASGFKLRKNDMRNSKESRETKTNYRTQRQYVNKISASGKKPQNQRYLLNVPLQYTEANCYIIYYSHCRYQRSAIHSYLFISVPKKSN